MESLPGRCCPHSNRFLHQHVFPQRPQKSVDVRDPLLPQVPQHGVDRLRPIFGAVEQMHACLTANQILAERRPADGNEFKVCGANDLAQIRKVGDFTNLIRPQQTRVEFQLHTIGIDGGLPIRPHQLARASRPVPELPFSATIRARTALSENCVPLNEPAIYFGFFIKIEGDLEKQHVVWATMRDDMVHILWD
jgi:hypothetical protein